jgi:hypothetical protein
MKDIISVTLAAITLACCMFTLYSLLAPIIKEEDNHDDLDS